MSSITQDAASTSRPSQRVGNSRVPATFLQPTVAPQPLGEPIRIDQRGSIHSKMVCLLKPRSKAAESYLRLRNAVEILRPPNRGIIVAVTSPAKGDGKTLTAINLAGSLAQNASSRVLLVDLDLRQPGLKVQDYLGLKVRAERNPDDGPHDGVKTGTDQADYHLKEHNLYLTLSAGNAASPYELLKSDRLEQFFKQASETFDYVIVDTPPMLHAPDIELIARLVDGFLVVIKADTTQQSTLEEALNLMREDQMLGLVLNRVSANTH
jgi:Mrp family chromosome partitioning ATPase